MVGVKGLEPSAPWSQTKYSNHTELHPVICYGCNYNSFFLNVKCFYVFITKKIKIFSNQKESINYYIIG